MNCPSCFLSLCCFWFQTFGREKRESHLSPLCLTHWNTASSQQQQQHRRQTNLYLSPGPLSRRPRKQSLFTVYYFVIRKNKNKKYIAQIGPQRISSADPRVMFCSLNMVSFSVWWYLSDLRSAVARVLCCGEERVSVPDGCTHRTFCRPDPTRARPSRAGITRRHNQSGAGRSD